MSSTTLQQLVHTAVARHGHISVRKLADYANDRGRWRITHTTLNNIRAGTYKSEPTDETVRAIAWLAGVEDDVAYAAAGLRTPGKPFADELPPGTDHLSPKARKAVIELLRVLIAQEEVRGRAPGSERGGVAR